jgi:hypothetical protein
MGRVRRTVIKVAGTGLCDEFSVTSLLHDCRYFDSNIGFGFRKGNQMLQTVSVLC